MYIIRYVQDDALRIIETVSREKANQEYLERINDPSVTELEPCVLTVDVQFSTSSKTYTYFIDINVSEYRYIKTLEGDTLYIVCCKQRTVNELKAMAKSRGFSFADYKVLHGTAIK